MTERSRVLSAMPRSLAIKADTLNQLDLSPVAALLQTGNASWTELEQQLQFSLEFPRDPEDPRELSEIPEVRLWFLRLNARYPWIVLLLDWRSGELARYVAMLVPHQFHPTEGIQFNPEALELWLMHCLFQVDDWLQQQGQEGTSRLKSMAQILGYELDDDFFKLLRAG
jgi:hypothetical protein